MTTPFTQKEKDLLTSNGWEVESEAYAAKNYNRIKKVLPEEFEVATLVTAGPDDNDYWEWDSGYRTLEKAMRKDA